MFLDLPNFQTFLKKNILNPYPVNDNEQLMGPLKMFAVKKSLEPLVRRKFEKKMSKFLPGIVYIRVALSEH